MSYEGKRVIGITGGIGSGKTKVLELLKNNYDVLIIEADKVAHMLQRPGELVYDKIVATFGEDILEEYNTSDLTAWKAEKKIDRKKLGAIVFADNHKLELLNNITHPAVHEHISEIISKSDKSLIFIEAAILTKTSLVDLTDTIWYVYADEAVRLERLQKYRDISEKKARLVMSNQPDERHFKENSDVIIDNSYTKEDTLHQIERQINNEIKKIQEEHYE